MRLAYTAYDGVGKATTGVIEADDAATANEMLRGKGLYVAALTEQVLASTRGERRRARRVSNGQKLKHLALFSRQLHMLLSSGMPLVEALYAVERQVRDGPWRHAIGNVCTRVEEGASLSVAMEADGGYFDPIYRSLITAGESSGQLVEMFDRLATLKQKQLKIRNSIVGALIYPCMLLTLGLAIFSLLLLFVVPRFSTLFTTLDVPLPSSTVALVEISAVFRRCWWLVPALLAGVAFGVRRYLATSKGRRLRDATILRLPCIGKVAVSLASARIVCLLGVLLEARIPVLEALRLTRDAAGNLLYRDLIAQAEERVSRGEPMSQAFCNAALFSPSVFEAIRSGEQTGNMDRLLLNISGFLDEENEVIVRSLTSIIEPLILIFMGLLVGLISICMFMPLFDLTAMTGGGG